MMRTQDGSNWQQISLGAHTNTGALKLGPSSTTSKALLRVLAVSYRLFGRCQTSALRVIQITSLCLAKCILELNSQAPWHQMWAHRQRELLCFINPQSVLPHHTRACFAHRMPRTASRHSCGELRVQLRRYMGSI